MTQCRIITIVAGLLLVTFAGCLGRKTVLQNYYLIEQQKQNGASDSVSTPVADAACLISPVRVRSAFSGQRIAVRTGTHELNYYGHHQWAVRPEEALSDLMLDYFRRRPVFSKIFVSIGKSLPRYRLETEIKHLEVIQQKSNLLAHINVSFRLRDAVSRNVIQEHTADRRLPLSEKDLNLFAAYVSEVFCRQLEQFSDKLTVYFSNNQLQSGSY
jgi:ABC-type uncharacterized transport system auxiliary subunit